MKLHDRNFLKGKANTCVLILSLTMAAILLYSCGNLKTMCIVPRV